ncbi:hypothetical protein [Actinoplanes sp. NPDC051859]|uniref:hypothetical protein n=1 Tax=Actinoplanes sp. NPDC051859 TaxID=3363909 RepID=UPI0037AF8C78
MYIGPDNHGEVDALVLTIARHGSTLQVGTSIVVLELACRAYEFTIDPRFVLAPQVRMTRTGDILFGGHFEPHDVGDTRPGGGTYPVLAEAAARLAATRDRHGQCFAYATYSHHLCSGRKEHGFCRSGPRGCACQGRDTCYCNDSCRTPYPVSGAALGLFDQANGPRRPIQRRPRQRHPAMSGHAVGDAAIGDQVYFTLPAAERRPKVEHSGVITELQRLTSGRHPVIAFVVHGSQGGVLQHRPELHILFL